ncbi:MAG: hypothetical protein EA378_06440 [Phycisphaerales bacterium]|nr:MAG: hypothetical protein EA378_06440 [Phycisphaerales bacterium]
MPIFLRWLLALGPTNPIAVRLVQNGSRRRKHLLVRSLYLAALIIVLLWALLLNTQGDALDYRQLARAGAQSFTYVAYLQVGLICVLAPVFMAGAISQEADPRTWDILLTTPLSGPQIVLGNLFGRLFFILALLLASLPLFAITQYFGGVPGRSIMASYLIAACAALFVGTVAIALSVSRLAGKRAVFTFYVAVVSYLALTAGLDAVFRNAGMGAAGGAGVTWMTAINPFLTLHALLEPAGYPRAPEGTPGLEGWFLARPVRTYALITLLSSLLLMLASTLTVRTGGLQQFTSASGGARAPWYRRLFGLGAAGSEHRAPRSVWSNPVAWREAAARQATLPRILARWSFIAAGALLGLALVVVYHLGGMDTGTFRLALAATVLGEVGVIALVAVNNAATAVSREREDGTLDLLLTTPITPQAYLGGKLRGLVTYLLPMLAIPLGTLLLAGAYVLVAEAIGKDATTPFALPTVGGPGRTLAVPVILPEAGLLAAASLIPFIAACVMVGLQTSVRSKGTIGAVMATVGVVGVLAGLVGLCAVRAGADMNTLGPVLAGLSPAGVLFAVLDPADAMFSTVSNAGELTPARVGLAIGVALGAAAHLAIVYAIKASMTRNFDFTVRKLAGTK